MIYYKFHGSSKWYELTMNPDGIHNITFCNYIVKIFDKEYTSNTKEFQKHYAKASAQRDVWERLKQ